MNKENFPYRKSIHPYSSGEVRRSKDYESRFKKDISYTWYDILPYSCSLWPIIYSECASSGEWSALRENVSNIAIEYIMDGCLEVVYDKETQILKKGDVFVTYPGTNNLMRNHQNDSCRHIQIVLRGSMTRLIPESLGIINCPYFKFDTEERHREFLSIARRLKEIIRQKELAYARENAELAYKLLLILAEIHTVQQDNELPQIISNAVSMMKDFNNICKSTSELAERLNVSRATLTRLFRKYFNTPPGVFWNFIKIETAKTMLSNSSRSIKEIAEMLNYENQFYFSTVFKRETGMSPREYRKKSAAVHPE
jgi:AraC-like DNA-binding protein